MEVKISIVQTHPNCTHWLLNHHLMIRVQESDSDSAALSLILISATVKWTQKICSTPEEAS